MQQSINKYVSAKEIISNQYLVWPLLIFTTASNLDDIDLPRFAQTVTAMYFYSDRMQSFNSVLISLISGIQRKLTFYNFSFSRNSITKKY